MTILSKAVQIFGFLLVILINSINSQDISPNKEFYEKYADKYKFLERFYYESDLKTRSEYISIFSHQLKPDFQKTAFREGGKYGIMDVEGNIIEKPEFDFFNFQQYPDIKFGYKSGCWYVFDRNLNKISDCEYDDFDIDFRKKCVLVKKDSLWGIVDQDFNYIIETKFKDLSIAVFGKLLTYRDGQKYILMDYNDKIVYSSNLPIKVDKNTESDLTFRKIFVGNKAGMLKNDSQVAILPLYLDIVPLNFKEKMNFDSIVFLLKNFFEAGIFYNEKNIIPIGNLDINESKYNRRNFIYTENGKFGLFQVNFNSVIKSETKYDELINLQAKFGTFQFDEMPMAGKMNNKWGIISCDNFEITDFVYDSVFSYSSYSENGKTKFYFQVKKNDLWGLLDYEGREIYKLEFEEIIPLKTESFLAKKNKKFGIINTRGDIIKEFELDGVLMLDKQNLNIDNFIGMKDGKYGILNNKGISLFDFKLIKIEVLNRETIKGKYENGKFGIINHKGEVIVDFLYDDIIYNGGYYIGKSGQKLALINSEGYQITTFAFSEILKIKDSSYFKAKKDGKYGLISYSGGLILDYLFDDIIKTESTDESEIAIAIKDGKYGIINILYNHGKNRKLSSKIEKILKDEYKDYLSANIEIIGRSIVPFEYDEFIDTNHSYFIFIKNKKYSLYSTVDNTFIPVKIKEMKDNNKKIQIDFKNNGMIIMNNKNEVTFFK